MIKVRYENTDPPIVDTVTSYEYRVHDGAFELFYWIDVPGAPPEINQVGKDWNMGYDRIYLELITPDRTRRVSFADNPASIIVALDEYETEIALATLTEDTQW